MAGHFPEGREFNIHKDAAAAKKALDNWPTPVIFSGFEIGEKIKTGLPLIQGFVRQIGGTATWEVDGGTRLTIEFDL